MCNERPKQESIPETESYKNMKWYRIAGQARKIKTNRYLYELKIGEIGRNDMQNEFGEDNYVEEIVIEKLGRVTADS